MSPLLPKGKRGWQDDPGHIHEHPAPPDEEEVLPIRIVSEQQDQVGLDVPAIDSITVQQASEEAREPLGEPAPVPEPSEVEVPRALAQEIRRAMKRYPEKRSASIPALWAVQRRYGWCSPEGIEQAATVMGLTPAYLQSVASFYDLFHLEPHGDHEVLVCTNISCWLRGADDILGEFIEAAGEPDDIFVRGFECLGACDIAPMVSIDERYYGPLEQGDAAEVVEQLSNRRDVLPGKRLADRGAAGGARAGTDPRVTKHTVNKVKQKRVAAKAKPSPAKQKRKPAPAAKRRSRR